LLRAHPDELGERFTRLLILLSGVAGSLLLVLRALGPVFLAMTLVACVLLGRRAALGALLRRRDARWTLGVSALVAVFALAWLMFSGLLDSQGATPAGAATSANLEQAIRYIAFTRLSFWINQIIGQFSYGETTLPSWTIVSWYLMVGALVAPALAVVRRFHALVLLGVLAASFGALSFLELAYLHSIGWSQHGRYIMPFGVGLILGAVVSRRYERAMAPGVRRLVPGVAIVAGILQMWALLLVQTRFQFGQGHGLNPLGGSWTPPLGSLVPLLAEFVGVAVLAGVACWVAWERGDGAAGTAPEEPGTRSAGTTVLDGTAAVSEQSVPAAVTSGEPTPAATGGPAVSR
jgi:hypothetical protein